MAEPAHEILGLLADIRDRLARITDALSGRDTSVMGGARVVGPAAGDTIATTDVIPEPGLYEITVLVASGAAADVGIFEVRSNNQLVLDGIGGGNPATPVTFRRRLDGESALSVRATVATASQTAAAIVANRLGK